MKMDCPNCDQHLDIPDELAGQTIDCPACGENFAVENAASEVPESGQSKLKFAQSPKKPGLSKKQIAQQPVTTSWPIGGRPPRSERGHQQRLPDRHAPRQPVGRHQHPVEGDRRQLVFRPSDKGTDRCGDCVVHPVSHGGRRGRVHDGEYRENAK